MPGRNLIVFYVCAGTDLAALAKLSVKKNYPLAAALAVTVFAYIGVLLKVRAYKAQACVPTISAFVDQVLYFSMYIQADMHTFWFCIDGIKPSRQGPMLLFRKFFWHEIGNIYFGFFSKYSKLCTKIILTLAFKRVPNIFPKNGRNCQIM
jgi:hypothetical protein